MNIITNQSKNEKCSENLSSQDFLPQEWQAQAAQHEETRWRFRLYTDVSV